MWRTEELKIWGLRCFFFLVYNNHIPLDAKYDFRGQSHGNVINNIYFSFNKFLSCLGLAQITWLILPEKKGMFQLVFAFCKFRTKGFKRQIQLMSDLQNSLYAYMLYWIFSFNLGTCAFCNISIREHTIWPTRCFWWGGTCIIYLNVKTLILHLLIVDSFY